MIIETERHRARKGKIEERKCKGRGIMSGKMGIGFQRPQIVHDENNFTEKL
jgi:hypothetical protein